MMKDHMKEGIARGGGVPSLAIGVHSMVGDDQNDTVVVQIVLSKDEILGLFTRKKPHFQLEVGMSMEDSSVEKHKARRTSYAEASGWGWSWMEARLSAGRKAEVLEGGSRNRMRPRCKGCHQKGGG